MSCQTIPVHHHSSIYEIFPRQQLAFDFFDEISIERRKRQNIKIYAFESTESGTRKFLVASWNTFIEEYLKDGGGHGHMYELIRDKFPCRAYFDLEFTKAANESVDGNALTAKWINLATWKIYELFGICLGPEHIVVLDSSSLTKFSKHVIFILPSFGQHELLFRNNAAVGSLMEHILVEMTAVVESSPSATDRKPKRKFADLLISKEDSKKTCFADIGETFRVAMKDMTLICFDFPVGRCVFAQQGVQNVWVYKAWKGACSKA